MSALVQVPVSPDSTGTVETLQTWVENLAYKNGILEQENKSLKIENQKLKAEMEKMSLQLKNIEQENLRGRKLRKIKNEPPGGNYANAGELLGGSEVFDVAGPSQTHNFMSHGRQIQRQDTIIFYTCNICKYHMRTRHDCTVCEFHLCIECFGKLGHPHKMRKIVDEQDRDNCIAANHVSPGNPVQSNSQEDDEEMNQKLTLRWCIQAAEHQAQFEPEVRKKMRDMLFEILNHKK